MADPRVNIYDHMPNYERELGQISTKLEYLKEELMDTESGLAATASEGKELKHIISDFIRRFDEHDKDVEEVKASINRLTDMIEKHILSSVNWSNDLSSKVGKFVIGLIIAAATIVGVDYFKPVIAKIFQNN